ncbi:MAG: 4-hydroxy-tetrahydrodipicolinate reductase [Bacteroidetes bacterium]|nr:MAG: 4-hydroxy-tetrahydrodipicolinate reductase [Bacteroidota bacterium]
MRIALIGTGQMGTAVEHLARQRGDEVVARFNTSRPLSQAEGLAAFNGADVAIDVSLPGVVLDHIERCCRWGMPLVVGTTGWYDALPRVRQWVEAHDAAVLYAANFSLGIALLTQVLRHLTPLLDRLPDYDVALHEVHHTRKADSPSGTALMLARILLDGLGRKTHLATETQHQRIDPDALHVTSTRTGHVIGTHTVAVEGPHDRLLLTHEATSRDGFAAGMLQAAAWLPGRRGLFTLEDALQDGLPAPTLSLTTAS